jgi:hypothetical protein
LRSSPICSFCKLRRISPVWGILAAAMTDLTPALGGPVSAFTLRPEGDGNVRQRCARPNRSGPCGPDQPEKVGGTWQCANQVTAPPLKGLSATEVVRESVRLGERRLPLAHEIAHDDARRLDVVDDAARLPGPMGAYFGIPVRSGRPCGVAPPLALHPRAGSFRSASLRKPPYVACGARSARLAVVPAEVRP